jgi:hypothetical protein
MVTVCDTASAPPERGKTIAVAVDAALKSAVVVVGGVTEIEGKGRGGEQSRHSRTVRTVVAVSAGGPPAVHTKAVVLGVEVKSRHVLWSGLGCYESRSEMTRE